MSVVYGREVNGEETSFGTTGYTYKNTFLLYDRKTESVWYPLNKGEMNAITGKLKGHKLSFIEEPEIMTLKEWRTRHPKTKVLLPQ